mmetsp:Transcript_79525/g.207428  ORF Transcript_79525/g.207428 Transcript_79525/m.207428 type:complete len:252 (-) Transcript_79525:525-1280(-)
MYLGEPPSPSSLRGMDVALSSMFCARPKSHILAFPAPSSSTFMDFMSRCTTRCECRNARPSTMWQAIVYFCMGIIGGFRRAPKIRSCSEPPDMNSVTTSSCGGWTHAPMNRTSRGCLSRRRALTSFFISCRCATPLIFLMATSWPCQEPRYTCAEPPDPSEGPNWSCSGRMSSFQPMVSESPPPRVGDWPRDGPLDCAREPPTCGRWPCCAWCGDLPGLASPPPAGGGAAPGQTNCEPPPAACAGDAERPR